MSHEPVPLKFNPGIQRDGTRLSSPGNWIDGQWVRFHSGMPRKMKGYRMLTDQGVGIQRSFENYFSGGTHYLHMGSNAGFVQLAISDSGIPTPTLSRTPAALTYTGNELWQMDTVYDPIIGNAATLIAHAGNNLNDISSSTNTTLYYGASASNAIMLPLSGLTSVSGGCCVVGPYVTFFGNGGYIGWGGPNKINDMTVAVGGGEAWVTGQKIVAGRPIQGGNGPAALYWSIDAVVRSSFIGGTATWAFDVISHDSSVMSSRCMATFGDSIYFWLGTDCFYVYAGTVRKIQNPTNAQWLFDNINRTYRQKCFTFVNKRWGEVWFCFPKGTATECSHAVIYNVDENYWYDTALPAGGRSGALSSGGYAYPIMGGVDLVGGSTYRVWQHETSTDEYNLVDTFPIEAYIESSDITLLAGNKPQNQTISVHSIEPDITQVGQMSLTITGNANARSSTYDAETMYFDPGPVTADYQLLRPKAERRQMRFKWRSNVLGGDFQMGNSYAHFSTSSGRETG